MLFFCLLLSYFIILIYHVILIQSYIVLICPTLHNIHMNNVLWQLMTLHRCNEIRLLNWLLYSLTIDRFTPYIWSTSHSVNNVSCTLSLSVYIYVIICLFSLPLYCWTICQRFNYIQLNILQLYQPVLIIKLLAFN